MRKSIKIALILTVAILVLLLIIEYSGLNAQYKTPQPVKVNPELVNKKDPQ